MYTDIFMVILLSSSERVMIIQSVFDPVFLSIPSFHKWQLSSYREALLVYTHACIHVQLHKQATYVICVCTCTHGHVCTCIL